MKRFKFLMPVAVLAILFTVAFSVMQKNEVKKDPVNTEASIGLPSAKVALEAKEAYKLDDAEYKGAVATKTSISGIDFTPVAVVAALIGILALFANLFRKVSFKNLFSAKTQITIRLAVLAFAVVTLNGTLALIAILAPIGMQWSRNFGIEAGEFKEIMEGISKTNGEVIENSVKKHVGEATKGLMTSEELTTKLEALGLKENAIAKLAEAVEKQGTELRKMLEGNGKPRIVKSIDELVHENAEKIQKMASADKGDNFRMRVSANADKTIVERASVSSSTMAIRLPGIGQLATRNLVMDQVFPTVNLSEADVKESNGVIRYMDVNSETRNAAETAEKGTKPESAISGIERTAALQVIADTIPVTKQAYRSLGFVAGEIDRLLRRSHALRKDQQLYSGDGNAPNIKGIYTYSTAATLANLPNAGGLVDPNLYDLIANLAVYISNGDAATGKQGKYMANVVLMNPADILKYKLAKAVDGHYILPPFISADGKVIDGVRVVETSVVTKGTLVLGDFNYGTIYQSEDLVIEMGWINDQFIKNQWTIRAEQELMLLVRNADLDAFTKITDIDAAVASLAKP